MKAVASLRVRARPAPTEGRILRSARRLLARYGGENVSMRDIAADAGITIGAIYKHFSDRDALFDRVVGEVFGALEAHLRLAMSRHRHGSFDRVVALGGAYIEFAERHPEEFKLLFLAFRRPRPLQVFPGRATFALLRTAVAEAMESGDIRADDPDIVAFMLWSRVHGIITLLLACDFDNIFSKAGASFPPAVAFQRTGELIRRGLLPVVPRPDVHPPLPDQAHRRPDARKPLLRPPPRQAAERGGAGDNRTR